MFHGARRRSPPWGHGGKDVLAEKGKVRLVTGTRLAILGPVRAWSETAELDLGSPQQRGALGPRGTPGMVRIYVGKLRQKLAA